jgi:hypothetical protein
MVCVSVFLPTVSARSALTVGKKTETQTMAPHETSSPDWPLAGLGIFVERLRNAKSDSY